MGNEQRNVVSFQMTENEYNSLYNIPAKVQKRKDIDKMRNRSMSLSNKANKQSSSPSVLSELFYCVCK